MFSNSPFAITKILDGAATVMVCETTVVVTHVVTKEGRLLLCRIDKTENVTEAEANDPDVFWSPTGSFRMHTSLHDSKFQGVVRFYGCEGDHRDGTWQWHDYNAKFVDGQLVTIECNMRRTD